MTRTLGLILMSCLSFALAAGGCDGGKTGGSSPSGKEGREHVANMNKVKITRMLPADVLVFDASVSPDGSRVALKRNVSERMNVQLYNLEVDGKAAPQSFDGIDGPKWSGNGKSYIYAGRNFKPQPTQHYLVHESTVYGPYPDWRAMGISPDGSTACVVFSTVDAVRNVTTFSASVNGKVMPLPFDADDVRFVGPNNSPVFRKPGAAPTGTWVDAAGASVVEPPAPEQPVAIPTIAVTMKLAKGADRKEPKRAMLSMNGAPAGDFHGVLHAGGKSPTYPPQFGFLQPDGRTFVYVVDGNRLDRLWFR